MFSQLKLKNPIMLAPLSGISALPYRMLNREFGCECCVSEMISARSLCYRSKKSVERITVPGDDRPLGIQLAGSESKYLLGALEKLRDIPFDFLDLNAACPERKVTKKDEGAGLLRDSKQLQKLLKDLVKHADVPVTVKMRLGWDSVDEALDLARSAEDAGVSAVFMHGRTVAQRYRNPIHYDILREVKKTLSIPLIASGDILSAGLAKKMFTETGCDAILVARGGLGNPWLFREIVAGLAGKTLPPRPSREEIADTMGRHYDMTHAFFGERRGTIVFRKFYVWYLKGLPRTKELKHQVVRATTIDDMHRCIDNFRFS